MKQQPNTFKAIAVLLFIGSVALMIGLVGDIATTYNTYNNAIGKKVVYKKDTLLVIDYSLWRSTFTLGGGIEIHEKLIDDIEVIEFKKSNNK